MEDPSDTKPLPFFRRTHNHRDRLLCYNFFLGYNFSHTHTRTLLNNVATAPQHSQHHTTNTLTLYFDFPALVWPSVELLLHNDNFYFWCWISFLYFSFSCFLKYHNSYSLCNYILLMPGHSLGIMVVTTFNNLLSHAQTLFPPETSY